MDPVGWGRTLFRRLSGQFPASARTADEPEAAPRLGHCIVIGHSHIHALMDAQANRIAANRSHDGDITFIRMLDPAFDPNLQFQEGKFTFNPILVERLQEAIAAAGGRPTLVDCISGNEYHAFGLAQHTRPFDFVLPSAPHLPLEPGAEIIPSTLIAATMRHAIEYAEALLNALRAATTLPIWHVQSPPPVRSQDHIVAYPTHFKDAIQQYGVTPAMLRYKLWRLQSEAYRDACQAAGIHFLSTPPDALDPDGFLLASGWNPEPTHANSWFGELVLAQFGELHGQKAGT